MKIHLVDFENVKSKGLTGIDSLDENDTVVIFYSENSDTISFEMHQKVLTSKADIQYLKVNVGGKNALDFQLSTLLGYLVANEKYSDIFIISNDRGFDFLHDFWSEKCPNLSNSTVLRMRTIYAAANYKSSKNISETTDETEYVSEEKEIEPAASIEEVNISENVKTENKHSELIPEQPTETVEIFAEENTVSADKENEKNNKETNKRERGYMHSLARVLSKSNCTEEETLLISSLLLSSKTKEELHNLLAKNFKQQATELYKLLRPRYLRLKEMYYKENPNETEEVTVNEETDEKGNSLEEDVVYHDVISSRLAELLAGICSADDLTKVEDCFNSAQTKQQLYIRMVKVFKKEKGCEIYNAVRGEYTNIHKQKQEV